jgi:hypothetical protein
MPRPSEVDRVDSLDNDVDVRVYWKGQHESLQYYAHLQIVPQVVCFV